MKTPILRPATEAVLFGFERIGMAIRIAWLPVVIVIGLYTVSFARLVGFGSFDSVDIFGGDPQEAIRSLASSPDFVAFCMWQSALLSLLASLILSCVYVALTRASTLADYEPPKLPFYFAFGGRELRYFIVRLLYALLIIFATLILAAAGAGVAAFAAAGFGAVEGEAKALIVAPTAAVGVLLFLVWLWVLLRFLPALPIAAVENRIAFGDAWKMTKGNFWRLLLSGVMFLAILEAVLFVFILALFVPAAIVLGLIAALGLGFFGPSAVIGLGLLVLIAVPAAIALAAFSVAAQAAFPARIYAYLSGCGEACRI